MYHPGLLTVDQGKHGTLEGRGPRGEFSWLRRSLVDGDQDQEEKEAEDEDAQKIISSSSFLPQRITRSKFKELGSSGQMFSLFVVSFV